MKTKVVAVTSTFQAGQLPDLARWNVKAVIAAAEDQINVGRSHHKTELQRPSAIFYHTTADKPAEEDTDFLGFSNGINGVPAVIARVLSILARDAVFQVDLRFTDSETVLRFNGVRIR